MPRIDYSKMFTKRKDGRFVGTYTDESGRHYIYDRDPKALFQKLQEKKNPEVHVYTFKEVANGWEREHREEVGAKTWNNYAPHLKDMISQYGDMPIESFEAADIANDLARSKAKGLSATVVNTRKSMFRMIFDYAIVKGYIKYNPALSVRLPKGLKRGKRTAPTQDQMKKILNSVSAPFGLFPFLLLCTGLRKSEALALTWADIDFKKKEISITKSIDYTNASKPKFKEPKTEAGTRTIPIIEPLEKVLKKEKESASSEFLFAQPDTNRGGKGGGLMSQKAYDNAWERYCKATGLEGITAHNLRHGTATLMFEFNVDELTAQRILGHSRIEITRGIYTDLREQQAKKSAKKFERGLSKMLSTKATGSK